MYIVDLPSQLSREITYDHSRLVLCANKWEPGGEENISDVLTCYDLVSEVR